MTGFILTPMTNRVYYKHFSTHALKLIPDMIRILAQAGTSKALLMVMGGFRQLIRTRGPRQLGTSTGMLTWRSCLTLRLAQMLSLTVGLAAVAVTPVALFQTGAPVHGSIICAVILCVAIMHALAAFLVLHDRD